jgi:catechol-2,3-dioxygenase
MTLGDGFHTLDIAQHPAPRDAPRPQRGQLGLAHIAFKVASYAALREAYAHLLKNGVEIQRAADHVCQRSIYFADPTAMAWRSIMRCRGRWSYFRTVAATRTKCCR